MGGEESEIAWDESRFRAAVRTAADARVIHAAGQRVSEDQLRQLLAAARDSDSGRPRFTGVDFRRAVFSGDADFEGTTFIEYARFDGATFSGNGTFYEAAFDGDAVFERATFSQNVDFSMGTFSRAAAFNGATFAGAGGTRRRPVQFLGTTFDGPTKFGWATFNVDAEFRGATFNWPAQFSGVTFDGSADFRGATLSRAAQFDGVIFREHATFGDATIGGDLGFQGATFEVQRGLTVHTQGQLLLDEAAYTEPVRIEACATVISCNSTLFRAGGDVFVCDTEVSIEDADFAGRHSLRLCARSRRARLHPVVRDLSRFVKPSVRNSPSQALI